MQPLLLLRLLRCRCGLLLLQLCLQLSDALRQQARSKRARSGSGSQALQLWAGVQASAHACEPSTKASNSPASFHNHTHLLQPVPLSSRLLIRRFRSRLRRRSLLRRLRRHMLLPARLLLLRGRL